MPDNDFALFIALAVEERLLTLNGAVGALENLGREVDSVNHLKLKGLDNGTLYRQVAVNYDLCFTRDAGFAHNVC